MAGSRFFDPSTVESTLLDLDHILDIMTVNLTVGLDPAVDTSAVQSALLDLDPILDVTTFDSAVVGLDPILDILTVESAVLGLDSISTIHRQPTRQCRGWIPSLRHIDSRVDIA